MAVALMFVIVVMREARQPGLYQTFFGGTGDNWVQLAPKSATPGLPASENQSLQNGITAIAGTENDASVVGSPSKTAPPPSSIGDIHPVAWPQASRWVDSMDVQLQRQWVESLIHLKSAHDAGPSQSGNSAPWRGLSPFQVEQSLNLLYAIDSLTESADQDAVLDSLGRLKSVAESGQFEISTWTDIQDWANPTLTALDAAALRRVSDGTFWTGKDSDAFYLQLWSSSALRIDGAVSTGTLPLLQQPQIYSGKTIRLVGTIQLAEYSQAQDNRAGIESYWKLWVIPADGGVRPTLLITAELPDALRRCIDEDGKWNRKADPANRDGQIEGVGRFIKRLPYRSSIGADLAPVLIGRIAAMPGAVASNAAAGSPNAAPGRGVAKDKSAQKPDGGFSGSIGILLAVIAGIALAGVLMYRTSADGRHSRQLRRNSLDTSEMNFEALSTEEPPPSKSSADPKS